VAFLGATPFPGFAFLCDEEIWTAAMSILSLIGVIAGIIRHDDLLRMQALEPCWHAESILITLPCPS
jgi:hypothetical protein